MRKKLFAVIMSAMMMITFMPSMAFAITDLSGDVSWDADYAGLTYKGIHYEATRTKAADFATSGLMTATCNFTGSGVVTDSTATINYFDLDNAKVVAISGEATSNLQYDVMNYDQFETTFGSYAEAKVASVPVKLMFTEPDYGSNYDKTNIVKSGAIIIDQAKARKVSMTMPAYDEAKAYEAQSFSLKVTLNYPSGCTAVKGSIPERKFQVTAQTPELKQVKFQKDGKVYKTGAPATAVTFENNTGVDVELPYDGQNHEITFTQVPGATLAITKYNTTTGNWDTVSGISFKNVVDSGIYKVAATLNNTTVTKVVNVTVKPVEIKVTLKTNSNGEVEVYKGVKYDLRDKVVFLNDEATSDANKAEYQAAATALKLHEAELNKLFDAAYEVKEEVLKVKISPKEGVDVKAAAEAIPEIANFDAEIDITAKILKEVEVKQNDVTACNQTKTFHVKKAKALKAKKTFQLKGDVVDFGEPIYAKKSGNSKITVAKDGTVTVKKGLKKGKYTVKIKVKAVCSNAASGYVMDTKTLKVKVVK